MTVFGRDASNFDGTVTFDGLGFFTHKVTEGTSVVHDRYGPRLNAARAAGVPVLGSYHVLRTPGSGGAGSLAQQLAWWVAQMDLRTPWWRTHPHFMLQVDAERWPYDIVSPATVLAFADLVARAPLPGWPVTYASRGQYGNSLRGLATALWNADYRGSSGGSYPGDNFVSSGGQAAGWAPYSGQEPPIFLQYTSTPYDHNAYRGTLEQLLTLVGGVTKGSTMARTLDEVYDLIAQRLLGAVVDPSDALIWWIRALADQDDALIGDPAKSFGRPGFPGLKQLGAKLDALAVGGVDLDALAVKVAALIPKPPTAAEVVDELARRLGNG